MISSSKIAWFCKPDRHTRFKLNYPWKKMAVTCLVCIVGKRMRKIGFCTLLLAFYKSRLTMDSKHQPGLHPTHFFNRLHQQSTRTNSIKHYNHAALNMDQPSVLFKMYGLMGSRH